MSWLLMAWRCNEPNGNIFKKASKMHKYVVCYDKTVLKSRINKLRINTRMIDLDHSCDCMNVYALCQSILSEINWVQWHICGNLIWMRIFQRSRATRATKIQTDKELCAPASREIQWNIMVGSNWIKTPFIESNQPVAYFSKMTY